MPKTKLNSFQVGYYQHKQSVRSTIWSIVHNLNKIPNITVLDEDGYDVIGDVIFTNLNCLTVSFGMPIKGEAYLS